LEELGKFHLERSEMIKCFPYFQECYEIRKKIIRKSTDEDIQRISCLLLYLHKNIEKDLRARESVSPAVRTLGTTPGIGAGSATARLMTLSDKLKAGVLNKLHS
jgi:hypothetical protein